MLAVRRIEELVETTSYAQVLQAYGRQTGFLQKMRSTSSFVRAIVAFGLFPLPWFLSSRRLHFGTSLDTLNFSSLRMFTFARCFHQGIAGYFARRRTLCQLRILNCTFLLQLYENCTAACTALGGISLTFRFLATSEIRSYHSRLFSSG